MCGMTVDPGTAKFTYSHRGQNYYFCCAHCLEKIQNRSRKVSGEASVCGEFDVGNARRPASAKRSIGEARSQVKDPVCGMDVDPSDAKQKLVHAGETYYFCSRSAQRSSEHILKSMLNQCQAE
jgi:YHS domain-containing protein